MNNTEELLELLNKFVSVVGPIPYSEFNNWSSPVNKSDEIILMESAYPDLVIKVVKVGEADIAYATTMGLIATITKVLSGKTLAAIVKDEKHISGFVYVEDNDAL